MTRIKACLSRGPFHRNSVTSRELGDLQARGAFSPRLFKRLPCGFHSLSIKKRQTGGIGCCLKSLTGLVEFLMFQFQVGDSIQRHRAGNQEPRWKRPYLVLLTTPTAVKVEGIPTWIHTSQVKWAPEPSKDEWELEKIVDPLMLHLHRRHCSE